MTILIICAVLIPLLEIVYDHWRWGTFNEDKEYKDDKPWSTIFRGISFVVFALSAHYLGYIHMLYALIFVIAVFMNVFDYGMNITRWKIISRIRGYQYSDRNLPDWLVSILIFFRRFCYHSNKGIDKIYSKIPPLVEIFFKLILLGTSIYFIS